MNKDKLDLFLREIKDGAAALCAQTQKNVVLLHHNDTDGLCSGAIMVQALRRAGFVCERFCLEKPYPAVLAKLLADTYPVRPVFVLTDFGSGLLCEISTLNRSSYTVFVLDHHRICHADDPSIILINGLKHGLLNHDFSASVLCYYFAAALDSNNDDLAWLGALGAFGDGFLKKGGLGGLNKLALDKAIERGDISGGSKFILKASGLPAREIIYYLDALGSVGYCEGGVAIALKGLLNGLGEEFFSGADKFSKKRKRCFSKIISEIQFNKTDDIQWFDLKGTLSGMGVKSVGLICEELKDHPSADPKRYIAGFQHIPRTIPGIGDIELSQTKCSFRVPWQLSKLIEKGERPSLPEILSDTAENFGGFLDGCHPTAAAVTVDMGKESEFIGALQEKIEKF